MAKRILLTKKSSSRKFNPAGFVDFSTEPIRMTYHHHPFIIVDVSRTIQRYSHHDRMMEFYQKFPLHDIIAHLLSQSMNMSAVPNELGHMTYATEDQLGEMLHRINFDRLELFYEQLTIEIEEEIARKAPVYMASGEYVFYGWVDPISICLCLDKAELQPGQDPRLRHATILSQQSPQR